MPTTSGHLRHLRLRYVTCAYYNKGIANPTLTNPALKFFTGDEDTGAWKALYCGFRVSFVYLLMSLSCLLAAPEYYGYSKKQQNDLLLFGYIV